MLTMGSQDQRQTDYVLSGGLSLGFYVRLPHEDVARANAGSAHRRAVLKL